MGKGREGGGARRQRTKTGAGQGQRAADGRGGQHRTVAQRHHGDVMVSVLRARWARLRKLRRDGPTSGSSGAGCALYTEGGCAAR